MTKMPSEKKPLLEIHGLHARVGEKEILRGIELAIRPGEVHTIMGPNGSGKSTLAGVLSGRPSYEVTAGSVSFDGRDLLALAPEERAREGAGIDTGTESRDGCLKSRG